MPHTCPLRILTDCAGASGPCLHGPSSIRFRSRWVGATCPRAAALTLWCLSSREWWRSTSVWVRGSWVWAPGLCCSQAGCEQCLYACSSKLRRGPGFWGSCISTHPLPGAVLKTWSVGRGQCSYPPLPLLLDVVLGTLWGLLPQSSPLSSVFNTPWPQKGWPIKNASKILLGWIAPS